MQHLTQTTASMLWPVKGINRPTMLMHRRALSGARITAAETASTSMRSSQMMYDAATAGAASVAPPSELVPLGRRLLRP